MYVYLFICRVDSKKDDFFINFWLVCLDRGRTFLYTLYISLIVCVELKRDV